MGLSADQLAEAKKRLTKEIQDALGRFGDTTASEPEIVYYREVDDVLADVHSGVEMRLEELESEDADDEE